MNVMKYVVDFVRRAVAASAVMTVSQHIEIGLTQRPASDLPVRVIERLTHRSIPSGVASVLAGQLAQGTLAAAAIALAKLTRRSPALLALASAVLLLSFSNALVSPRARPGRDAVALVQTRTGHRPFTQSITCAGCTDNHPRGLHSSERKSVRVPTAKEW